MTNFIYYFVFLITLVSCSKSLTKENKFDSNSIQTELNNKPISGYRFQIVGDFDGNGINDTLNEQFYSLRDKKETNKYYSDIDDVWVLYDSVSARKCISYFISNSKLDTLKFGGVLGPIWIKNEGDLDNDGGDEISIVESLAQQSSTNQCKILSYKKGKWSVMYSFTVREWQFPPLPQAGKNYGNFGVNDVYASTDDSLNNEIEKQMKNFKGLIQKSPTGKIAIQTFTPEVTDTIIFIDLTSFNK